MAEEVLVLRLLELAKNRLDLGIVEDPAGCDICFVNGHLLLQIQQVVQGWDKPVGSSRD